MRDAASGVRRFLHRREIISWQSRPASGAGPKTMGMARALRLSIACGRGTRVQAVGAFDNISKKPDVKGKVLSEAPPYAPGRRYRKPRLAASGEAFGQVRGGVGMPFWAVICYHKGCLLCSHKRTAPQGLMSTAPPHPSKSLPLRPQKQVPARASRRTHLSCGNAVSGSLFPCFECFVPAHNYA